MQVYTVHLSAGELYTTPKQLHLFQAEYQVATTKVHLAMKSDRVLCAVAWDTLEDRSQ